MDEQLISKQLPHDITAEQAVLTSMMSNNNCIPEVIGLLKTEDFYLRQNQDMYAAIFYMVNHALPVDVITVKSAMLSTGHYEANSLQLYLETMFQNYVTSANVKSYAEIVKDKSLLRNIATTSEEINNFVQSGTETGLDLLEVAEQRFHALRLGRETSGLVDIGEVLNMVYDRLIELSERGTDLPGISTGLKDLDKAISGLNKSDLILLAARPGMGKTSMALNILLDAGKFSKKTVAFFSLEMSMEQLAMRLISTESFLDNKKLTTGQLNGDDWEKIKCACESLLKSKIVINDDSLTTVADIKAKCRRVPDLGLIIIDYLQLMQSAGGRGKNGGENRQQVVSDISRALKIMAKELDVPVICLSQLSRASEKRENKRPVMSDLRDSGAIEQDADIVMFLYRDDYYEETSDNHNVAECIIAKNRHGETGTVELEWLPQFTTFRGMSHASPPPY